MKGRKRTYLIPLATLLERSYNVLMMTTAFQKIQTLLFTTVTYIMLQACGDSIPDGNISPEAFRLEDEVTAGRTTGLPPLHDIVFWVGSHKDLQTQCPGTKCLGLYFDYSDGAHFIMLLTPPAYDEDRCESAYRGSKDTYAKVVSHELIHAP